MGESLPTAAYALRWPSAKTTDDELREVVESDPMNACMEALEQLRSRKRVIAAMYRWEQNTLVISSTTQLVEDPAYKEIIAEGWNAVPVLIERMAWAPGWFSEALSAITGVHPEIEDEELGKLDVIAAWWVEWARKLELWP